MSTSGNPGHWYTALAGMADSVFSKAIAPAACPRVDNPTGRDYIHYEFRRQIFPGCRSLRTEPNCVFCQIVAGKSPARVRYVDNDIIVIVNRLDWVPLMLLVMPKEHLSQIGMWDCDLLPRLGKLAVDMGAMYSPNGFRVLSNFGRDGLQSQSHGHLHVVGGTFLGHYVEHDLSMSSIPSPYPTRP